MSLACDATRRLLGAYVDGELVGEDRAAVEAHVGGCDACRRLLADEESLAHAVRTALPPAGASDALRKRVERLFDAPPRAAPRRAWRAALAAGLVLLGLAAGYGMRPHPVTPAAGDLASFAAGTHLRYTRGQLPLEIGSEQPEQLSRWFAGRVPFNVALPDYPVGPGEQKFYRLLGGRLVSFRGDYAAYVAYSMEQTPISLLVTSSALATPSGGETVRFGALVFHQQSIDGLDVLTWTDKGLTYALASDVSVSGQRSCLVCHGSPEERRRIEGFPLKPEA